MAEPSKITGLTVTNPATGNTLASTWNADANAATYDIYYSNDPLTGWAKHGSTSGTSYTLTGLTDDTRYFVQIRGVSGSDETGDPSDIVAQTCSSTTRPASRLTQLEGEVMQAFKDDSDITAIVDSDNIVHGQIDYDVLDKAPCINVFEQDSTAHDWIPAHQVTLRVDVFAKDTTTRSGLEDVHELADLIDGVLGKKRLVTGGLTVVRMIKVGDSDQGPIVPGVIWKQLRYQFVVMGADVETEPD